MNMAAFGPVGDLAVLVCGLGALIGAIVTIWRYIVRPIARLIEEFQPVPHDVARMQADIAVLAAALVEHLNQTAPPPAIPFRIRSSS